MMGKQIVYVGGFLILLLISCTTPSSSSQISLPDRCNLFSFSPTLAQVIYRCNHTYRLASLPNMQDMVSIPLPTDTSETWSVSAWRPDGRAFLLNSYEQTEQTVTWWLVEVKDLNTRIPLCTRVGGQGSNVWSPTGAAFVAVDRMGGVMLVQANRKGCEVLPISGRVMKSLALSWSPDGQKIAYTDTPVAGPEASEIHVIDLRTRKTTKIYSDGGLPEWSPGGEK